MIGTSVMKESRRSSSIIHRKTVLTCCKAEFTFFLSGFSFHEYSRFMGQQVKGKAISWYPFSHFYPLYRRLDISRFIAAVSSPPRIAGRIRTENLRYPLFALVAAVLWRMLKTPVPLTNISRVLLNLIQRLIFVIFKDYSSLPMLTKLEFIFRL